MLARRRGGALARQPLDGLALRTSWVGLVLGRVKDEPLPHDGEAPFGRAAMPDTPDYLVTARASHPLSRRLDEPEPVPARRTDSAWPLRCSESRTPASWRRAWFDYVRESGNDLA